MALQLRMCSNLYLVFLLRRYKMSQMILLNCNIDSCNESSPVQREVLVNASDVVVSKVKTV